jgi:hypothetical protein
MFESCISSIKGYINKSLSNKTIINTTSELKFISVKNSLEAMFSRNELEATLSLNKLKNESANKIKGPFRRKIAAASYGMMFSEGSNFKTLGLDIQKEALEKNPLCSLSHLKDVSRHYLKKIKQKPQI